MLCETSLCDYCTYLLPEVMTPNHLVPTIQSAKARVVYRSQDTEALQPGDRISSWIDDFEWDESCVEAQTADRCVLHAISDRSVYLTMFLGGRRRAMHCATRLWTYCSPTKRLLSASTSSNPCIGIGISTETNPKRTLLLRYIPLYYALRKTFALRRKTSRLQATSSSITQRK